MSLIQKKKRTSDCDDSVGAHALESSVSDQSTRNNVNTDVKNNNDSKSFETPRKNICSYYYFGNTTIKITTPD